jgi:hypothetical protein
MRFEITQEFPVPAGAVQEAYLDPEFLEVLGRLPRLGEPELIEVREEAGRVHRQIRYRFAGELNSAVKAVIDPARLTWVERSTTDPATRETRWEIHPDHYADKLSSHGVFRIEASGDGSRRTASGEVKVRVMLVGGKVEGAIVSGMREHAELEREALLAYLEAKPEKG